MLRNELCRLLVPRPRPPPPVEQKSTVPLLPFLPPAPRPSFCGELSRLRPPPRAAGALKSSPPSKPPLSSSELLDPADIDISGGKSSPLLLFLLAGASALRAPAPAPGGGGGSLSLRTSSSAPDIFRTARDRSWCSFSSESERKRLWPRKLCGKPVEGSDARRSWLQYRKNGPVVLKKARDRQTPGKGGGGGGGGDGGRGGSRESPKHEETEGRGF